jgi:hypothetical protein
MLLLIIYIKLANFNTVKKVIFHGWPPCLLPKYKLKQNAHIWGIAQILLAYNFNVNVISRYTCSLSSLIFLLLGVSLTRENIHLKSLM